MPDNVATKTHQRRSAAQGLWLLLSLVLALCHTGTLVAQTDDGPTTRIVSLVPSLTEILFTLEAAPLVAGVSDYCIYPPQAAQKPRVGGLINPSLENVLAQRPTVVLLYRSQADFAAKLDRLNVRTEMFATDTLADIFDAIDRLGREAGHTTQATRLTADLHNSLRPATTGDAITTPTGVLIVSRDDDAPTSLYQADEATFLGELFVRAGGQLAIPRGTAIDREAIIRANPDIIIDMNHRTRPAADEPGDASATKLPRNVFADVGLWNSLATVNAVKSGRVYNWHDRHTAVPGPGVAGTMQTMRAIIINATTPPATR